MTLQKLLVFTDIVIDDTSVRTSVENLCAFIICQKVDTLINVFVKTKDPFQVLEKNNGKQIWGK